MDAAHCPNLLDSPWDGRTQPSQIRTFADKMLNGNAASANGTGGTASNLTAACVNEGASIASGTLSINAAAVTFSADQADYPNAGGALMTDLTVGYGRIVSWSDARHATLAQADAARSNLTFRYSPVSKQDAGGGIGHCGALWFMFHHVDAIKLFPGQERTWPTNYPLDGGNYSGYGVTYPNPTDYYELSVPTNNKMFTQAAASFAVALALADDDVRARNFLATTWNWSYLPIPCRSRTP